MKNLKEHRKLSPEPDSSWTPGKRIRRLLEDYRNAAPGLGAERALHYTEFFRKHARTCASAPIRMAMALKFHLERRTIRIFEDELIVGTHTEHRIGAICHVELAGNVMLEDLFVFEKREVNPLVVEKRHRSGLFFAMIWWFFRNLSMRAFTFLKKIAYLRDQLNATYFVINEAGGVAHFLPDYKDLIATGTGGLRKRIRESRARQRIVNPGAGKAQKAAGQNAAQPGVPDSTDEFLAAAEIALDAVDGFADRLRAEARALGRADLIAVLENAPRQPARNMQEALQTIWLFQMLIQIESLDQGISLGRADQYLYPLYLEDRKRGVSDDEIRDLLAAFCIKLSEIIPLFSRRVTAMFSGLPSGQALTLGGIGADGKSAVNKLTYLWLDVLREVGTRQPNWHARISEDADPDYRSAVYGLVARGGGSPALYNDDVIMPALKQRGFPEERVWNYATVGCVEPALPGESFTSSDAAIFNIPVALEIVLGEGRRLNRFARAKVGGKRTPLANIRDFDTLKREVFAELEHRIAELKVALDAIEIANLRYHPTPLSSLTVQGCIENARDLTAGGALINRSGIQGVGFADLADALVAIEQVVFKEKRVSLAELAKACKRNFRGSAELRARLLKAPKFGNDVAQVDNLAAEIAGVFDRLISSQTNTRGGAWMPGAYSMTCHRAFGSHMAALPSGRLRGQSLADGVAPGDGLDRLGPTASMNSSLRLDHRRFANGVNLNLKFDAKTISGKKGGKLLSGLVGGYFDQGGMQAQINVLDPKVLAEAMLHPERHRNLLVRISGYCAYFTDLTPEMQRELIARTTQAA